MSDRRLMLWRRCPNRYVMPVMHPMSLANNGISPELIETMAVSEDFEPEEIEELFLERDKSFWLVTTNFKLTEEDAENLDEFDGLEFWRIVTNYSMVLAVADLFNFQEFRKKLETFFCEEQMSSEEVLDMFHSMENKVRRWCLLESEEGELIEYCSSNQDEDTVFDEDAKNMKVRSNNCNGKIYSN